MKGKDKIILASASPRRRDILAQAGISFTVFPSDAEETITETEPEKAVEQLSLQKAVAVVDQQTEDCIVIGADTIVTLDGRIMGKPADESEAFLMIHSLQGRSHTVYTGVTLAQKRDGELYIRNFHEKTEVEVLPMTGQEIREYIAGGESLDKAGAYGIQGAFAAYIRGIRGDYYNVVGFPLCRFVQEWKKMTM